MYFILCICIAPHPDNTDESCYLLNKIESRSPLIRDISVTDISKMSGNILPDLNELDDFQFATYIAEREQLLVFLITYLRKRSAERMSSWMPSHRVLCQQLGLPMAEADYSKIRS